MMPQHKKLRVLLRLTSGAAFDAADTNFQVTFDRTRSIAGRAPLPANATNGTRHHNSDHRHDRSHKPRILLDGGKSVFVSVGFTGDASAAG